MKEPAMPVALRNYIDLHSLQCVWCGGAIEMWRVSSRGPQVDGSYEWRPYCYISSEKSLEDQIDTIRVNVLGAT